jgi:hypothetical protein
MGLYSTIETNFQCSRCDWKGPIEVQFKYGNLWNHKYTIGSRIVWGRTQIGDPADRLVSVQGIAACPRCNLEIFFDILIEGGVIRAMTPASGKYDYSYGEGHYLILDEM